MVIKRLIIWFIIVNVFFTAPMRYLFTFVMGLSFLNYLINALLIVLIIFRISSRFSSLLSRNVLIVLYIGVLIAYSFFHESINQIAFFIYLTHPLVFYALYNKELKGFIEGNFNIFILLFILSSAGIICDYFIDYPWKSLNYSIGNTEIEFSKDWTSSGVERIAGFTRSSFDAAMSVIILLCLLLWKLKNWVVIHIAFIITFFCVLLTTTKGCITSLIMIYVTYILNSVMEKGSRQLAMNVLMGSLLVLVVTIPLGLLNGIRIPFFNNDSLLDRIQNTWPFLMGQFKSIYQYILGLGVGSVGTAQFLFGVSSQKNLGDNLFLYLFSNFGILSFIMLFHLYHRFSNSENKLFLYVLVFTVSYGLTTNIFESSVGLILLSICFFYPVESSMPRLDHFYIEPEVVY